MISVLSIYLPAWWLGRFFLTMFFYWLGYDPILTIGVSVCLAGMGVVLACVD